MDSNTCERIIIVSLPLSPARRATNKLGTMATLRVMRFLFQAATFHWRKPSITNWPAYVPVIVELWPEAKRASAKKKFAYLLCRRFSSSRLALFRPGSIGSIDDVTCDADTGYNTWP